MTVTKDSTKKKNKEMQEEEFVDVSPSQRNWKGIAISLLVIVVVCSLITLSVVVLTPAEVAGSSRSSLTVADLFKPEFRVHNPEATWVSGSEVVYRNREGHVVKFHLDSNRTEVLLSNSTFVSFKASRFSLSPDLNFALFAYDVRRVYRYSHTASYVIYNIHTREVWELNPPEVQNAVLQHAAWGCRGTQLIFIFENNIYFLPDMTTTSLRVTSSGRHGVYNGISDWLYEEEVLRSHVAHWFSPDGGKLAFLSINSSLVPNMAVPRFTGSSYPRGLHYPYPAAGQNNPVVKLFVVDLFEATHTQELRPPESMRSDFYIVMVTWVGSSHLAVRWLSRSQNASVLTLCDITTGACIERHQETSDTWLSKQNEEPWFSRDRSRMFLLLPVRVGAQGDFHHLAMFSSKSQGKQKLRLLTSGDWEVTRTVAYDENRQIIYFLSTENSSQQRHLYSVSTLGLFPRRCLTCGLRDECSFYNAEISPNWQHALLTCKGPGVPAVTLLVLDDMDSFLLLEDNAPLRSMLETRRSVQSSTRSIPTDNGELSVKLTFPSDFSESFLYGLLLIIDSPPGSQAVTEEFRPGWDWVLVGSEVIVARVDGGGSGFRGQRVLHQIDQKVGTVDVQDQITALEYLVKLPYVDRTRTGVYGEGYGGYVALMMLKSTERMIRCSGIRAPVVDWSLYASAFSERFFGFPATEESKYQASKLLPSFSSQQGALFLAHGTADANVHFQHSAELVKQLIKIGANYTMQIFPDEGHFLSLPSEQQLCRSVVHFFTRCFLSTQFLQ